MRAPMIWLLGAALVCCAHACHQPTRDDAATTPAPPKERVSFSAEGIFADLSLPRPNVSAAVRARFERGRAVAHRRFGPEDGLGPDFNAAACIHCHDAPVVGGTAGHYRDVLLARAEEPSGEQREAGQRGVIAHYTLRAGGRNPTPPDANRLARRTPASLFGAGVLAAIPDEEILRHEDPEDRDGDGIRGRANRVGSRVARFGRKAEYAELETVVRRMLFSHQGVTTDPLTAAQRAAVARDARLLYATAPAPAGAELVLRDDDGAADPELTPTELADLLVFVATLASPAPLAPTPAASHGGALFSALGCSSCHLPEILSRHGVVPLYSDLLLHDMGDAMADGVTVGDAGPSEFRTAPLWGVIATHPYLHDGRAATLEEAVRAHGGEAAGARDRFVALSREDQADLLAFLASLGGEAQASEGRIPPGEPIPAAGELGAPLRELNAAEQAAFLRGRSLFDRDRGLSSGLGIEYNGDSCRGCHFDPVPGGAGPIDVDVNLQGVLHDGVVQGVGGATFIKRHAHGDVRPEPSPTADVFDTRQTPSLLGLGLLERVSDDTVVSRARRAIDGCPDVSGDYQEVGPARLVGRFGWQASAPALRRFARGASFHEMGITVPFEPGALFGDSGDHDDVPDPESTTEELDDLAFFLNLLAPPPPRSTDAVLEAAGAQLFETVGCACCHLPTLVTRDGLEFHPYTDLLLHDVAPEVARGIPDGLVSHRDFRTAPLWGLSRTAPYMHDGRASTVLSAVLRHAGEATFSTTRFEALDDTERRALLAFLASL